MSMGEDFGRVLRELDGLEGSAGKGCAVKGYEAPGWQTEVVSVSCQVLLCTRAVCGAPTVAAYPAMGGGWMALCELCESHAVKHRPHGCFDLGVLLEWGEVAGGGI